jgi:ankyrin repeat protein
VSGDPTDDVFEFLDDSPDEASDRSTSDMGPKMARPVAGGGDAGKGHALPKALAVPPRDESDVAAAGRWKVDSTMTPVAETASPAAQVPAAQNVVEVIELPSRGGLRGLLLPLGVCVVGLAATIVVALVTKEKEKVDAEEKNREVAKAKAANEKPPAPPPETRELIAAIRSGDHRVLKSLLDKKADATQEVGATTALATAVGRGDAVAAKLLLAAGADPNLSPADAPTPLLAAIEKSDVEMATVLLAGGAKPDAAAGRAGTPLSLAARKGNLPLIKLLLENKADPNVKTPAGDTALMLAARQGKVDLVSALVEAGADVNAGDANQMTPLMYALDGIRPEVVKLLLSKGADPLARRADGDSPLLIALTKNQIANYRTLDEAAGDAKQRLPGDSGPVPWKYLSELTPAEKVIAAKTPAAVSKVRGIDMPHGLWLAPPEDKKPAKAVYTLDKKFRFFQGFVAVADTGQMAGEQAVTFRIVGDGKDLWTSAELQKPGDFRNFRVEVAEVVKLELIVDCKAAAAGADAVWFEPKLVN